MYRRKNIRCHELCTEKYAKQIRPWPQLSSFTSKTSERQTAKNHTRPIVADNLNTERFASTFVLCINLNTFLPIIFHLKYSKISGKKMLVIHIGLRCKLFSSSQFTMVVCCILTYGRGCIVWHLFTLKSDQAFMHNAIISPSPTLFHIFPLIFLFWHRKKWTESLYISGSAAGQQWRPITLSKHGC